MQLVELGRLGRLIELIELEAVEVLGAAAGLFEHALDGARANVADAGRGLDRAAVPEALDDADDRLLGRPGIPQGRALQFGQPAWHIARYSRQMCLCLPAH